LIGKGQTPDGETLERFSLKETILEIPSLGYHVTIRMYSSERIKNPKTILAKGNESEIRMLVNGMQFCTSNSKHVPIKKN